MSVRPIVLLGDPRLRLKGKPVDSFGKYLHELLDDLAHTMRDAPGRRARRAAARRGAAGLRHRGRGPAPRAGQPADRPGDRRRPRPRGLPVDPGLRRLRDPPRAGLGRRPEPPRPEDQGRRVRAARSGAPARARPPRRQALHRLPRLDGRADGRSARATRTTRRSARRRAPWRDRPRAGARVRCGPSSSAAARSAVRASGASTRTPTVELVGVVTAPPRPAGRKLTSVATPDRRRWPRELGVAHDPDARRGCATRRRSPRSSRSSPELIVLADYGQIVPAGPARARARRAQPPSVDAAAPPRRDADPGHDPGRRPRDRRHADADGRGARHRPDRRPGAGRPIAPRRDRAASWRRGWRRWAPTCWRRSLGPWLRGELREHPQPTVGATLTRPLRREDGRLDLSLPAEELERQVRAYQPWPGSFVETRNGRLIGLDVERRRPSEHRAVRALRARVGLATGDGTLLLHEVQPAGGRRMPWVEYLRGRPGIVGSDVLADRLTALR